MNKLINRIFKLDITKSNKTIPVAEQDLASKELILKRLNTFVVPLADEVESPPSNGDLEGTNHDKPKEN